MSESKHEKPDSGSLFEDLPLVDEAQAQAAARARDAARRQGPARVLQPNRGQIELRASDLDSLLGEDHRARLVWGYVERQDLRICEDFVESSLLARRAARRAETCPADRRGPSTAQRRQRAAQ